MTPDDAFLAAILDDPTSDAPRLIYADWLEEHGDPRGEFIRVQCVMAVMRLRGQPIVWSDEDPENERYDALHRRERELLRDHHREFTADLPRGWVEWGTGSHGWERSSLHYTLRRGFVASVACTLAGWCGRPCPSIRVDGPHDTTCQCYGTGRIGGHGPALVRSTPLKTVRVSDKRPLPFSNGEFAFFAAHVPRSLGDRWPGYGPTEPNIPDTLFALMQGAVSDNPNCKTWPTEAAALAALSDACLTWARACPDPAAVVR